VSDFTSGTVTSASTAQQAGTAVYAVNAGTAVYATTSGTAVTITGDITKSQVSDFTSGTVASAGTAQQAGTAVFATTSGTATYATNSGTAVFATNASTAVTISGSITQSQVTNLTTDLAAKANLAGGNALTGAQTITSTDAGQFPLSIISATGQTASTFRVRNSANNADLMSVDSSGQIRTSTVLNPNSFNNSRIRLLDAGLTIDTGIAGNVGLTVLNTNASPTGDIFRATGTVGNFQITSSGGVRSAINVANSFGGGTSANNILAVRANVATNVPLIVSGAASQSADLLQLQNSAGGNLFTVRNDAQITTVAGINATGLSLNSFGGNAVANRIVHITTSNASLIPLNVRGASGQSGNLQNWEDSSANVLASINASGGVVVGTTHLAGASPSVGQIRTSTNTGLNYVDTTANDGAGTGPGYTARRARGTLSAPTQVQAGDLLFGIFAQGWHDAAGFGGNSAAIRMLANQNFTTTALGSSIVFETASDGTTGRAERMRITGSGTLSIGTTAVTGQLGVVSADAARQGLIVRGAASQSANLQEWQNSAGTVQARVNASGIILGVSLRTAQQWVQLKEENSGGALSLTKMTSAAGNDGAGVGRIYFRDGTNAGTLKLVVRAGAAGAETTILDNIPQ
jgi:hypothetical protein